MYDDDPPQIVGRHNQAPWSGESAVLAPEEYDQFNWTIYQRGLPREPDPANRETDERTDEWLMLNDPTYHPYGKVPKTLPPRGGNRRKHRQHRLVDIQGAYGFCRKCQRPVRADRNGKYYSCGEARKQRHSGERAGARSKA